VAIKDADIAALIFIVAVGSFIALKPKPKRQTAGDATAKMGWTLTGRIDLADPQSVGALVLEVEETRTSESPSGVEHREIRWRRATLPEAKMVLESYHAQQNLPIETELRNRHARGLQTLTKTGGFLRGLSRTPVQ
jgi:hypothetical protein